MSATPQLATQLEVGTQLETQLETATVSATQFETPLETATISRTTPRPCSTPLPVPARSPCPAIAPARLSPPAIAPHRSDSWMPERASLDHPPGLTGAMASLSCGSPGIALLLLPRTPRGRRFLMREAPLYWGNLLLRRSLLSQARLRYKCRHVIAGCHCVILALRPSVSARTAEGHAWRIDLPACPLIFRSQPTTPESLKWLSKVNTSPQDSGFQKSCQARSPPAVWRGSRRSPT